MKFNKTVKSKNGGYIKNNIFYKTIKNTFNNKGVFLEYQNFKKDCDKIILKASDYFKSLNINKKLNHLRLQEIEKIVNSCSYNYTEPIEIAIESCNNKNNINNKNQKDECKNTKIIITEENNIKKEIEITHDELMVLRIAVIHNKNTVNLLNSKREEIKILIRKGLLNLSNDGELIMVNKIIEIILKNNTKTGLINISDIESDLIKEIKSNIHNKNIINFEWDIEY